MGAGAVLGCFAALAWSLAADGCTPSALIHGIREIAHSACIHPRWILGGALRTQSKLGSGSQVVTMKVIAACAYPMLASSTFGR